MRLKLAIVGAAAVLLSATFAWGQNAPVTDCDKLAAHPDDPQRNAPGLPTDKIDAKTAVPACEAAVRQSPSDARLNFQLGRVYEKAGNFPLAVRQYQNAADQNYAPSQNALAFMYVRGLGIAKDDAKALDWFRKAADLGYPPAQANVGTMYQQGRGVARNSQEALKWYRLAAEKKYALAQLNLGFMFANGDGVGRDEAQALNWFRLAAEQGNAQAQSNLGAMYDKGQGVPKNEPEALKWLRLAAEQGDAAAQYSLGVLYAAGRGVPQNYQLAFMWSDIAAQKLSGEQGKQAANNREIFARILSAEQVAQAEELARQCVARGFKQCEAPPAATVQAAWQEYRPDDASYRVEMPGKPSVGTQDLKSSPGQKMYYASVKFEKGALAVSHSEIAHDRQAAPADKTLDELRDGIVKGMNARLLSEQGETVAGFPARRLIIDPANGLMVTQRIVLVKGRVYQIIATGPQGYSATPDVLRFLNSFAILKP